MADGAANYRMLHTMIRVKDLDKSIAFYTGPMGMKMLRKREVPDGKYTLAFVGYGDENEHCAVELTHNWDQEKPYDIGSGFGVKSLFNDPEIRAGYEKYSDINMFEKQQKLAKKKDVVSRWFGEWDETNGTAWQAAVVGKSSVADALKKSAQTWNDLKKQS